MYCNNCGNELPEGQTVCSVCSSFVGSSEQSNQVQQDQYQQNQYQQNQYQQNQYQQNQYNPNQVQQNMFSQNQYNQVKSHPDVGMNWFKFIIFVQLIVSAVSLLITGIRAISGNHYMDEGIDYSDFVYAFSPGLKAIDVIFGLVCIGMAAFALFVRFQLAGYKAKGPKMYLMFLVINIVITVIYIISASSVIGKFTLDTQTGTQIITSIVLIFANITYFKNREHLFIN